jgi:hypothetical protein
MRVVTGATNTPPTLSAGTNKLINVFPSEKGILVVLDDAVVLVARSGAELTRLTAPRTITAAAFDGQYLGVADAAILTTFLPDLTWHAATTLVEGCASAVVVGDSRLVCGPANDWDRIFYTYDLPNGVLLARSDKYTYQGIPIQRVPGTNQFLSLGSFYYVYSVGSDGKAAQIATSSFDLRGSPTYGFDNDPATHLITDSGQLVSLPSAPTCTADAGLLNGCIQQDGVLGTIPAGQRFVAFAQDGMGNVIGMTGAGGLNGACYGGCMLQRAAIATRTVLTSRSYPSSDVGNVVASHHDRWADRFLAGYTLSFTYPMTSAGYRVELVSYQ